LKNFLLRAEEGPSVNWGKVLFDWWWSGGKERGDIKKDRQPSACETQEGRKGNQFERRRTVLKKICFVLRIKKEKEFRHRCRALSSLDGQELEPEGKHRKKKLLVWLGVRTSAKKKGRAEKGSEVGNRYEQRHKKRRL